MANEVLRGIMWVRKFMSFGKCIDPPAFDDPCSQSYIHFIFGFVIIKKRISGIDPAILNKPTSRYTSTIYG